MIGIILKPNTEGVATGGIKTLLLAIIMHEN